MPSLPEAARVVEFILASEMKAIAGRVEVGSSSIEGVREMLALTIAVVSATEHMFAAVGPEHPDHWESMEQSAATFVDHYVLTTLAEADAEFKRQITTQRRRKLTARAGKLRLVESDRSKQARWASVTLSQDEPIPIANEVADGLAEATNEAEERLYATSTPSRRRTRWCSQVRSSACWRRRSACSRSCRRARWPRSASTSLE
jgi:hypothetical protein